ncbi:MAG: efflux RND transporter permease subunit, partial [Erysipelotrichaceae bacterium]|nr:efflux RND transporter permease subunit [Erysipelotrichaceae bacterium]
MIRLIIRERSRLLKDGRAIHISIPAIIGFISLFGIATRNGILLIDKLNQPSSSASQTAHPHQDIIISGSLDRLTPILMTALTSALALVPLALGGDLDGFMER